MAKTIHNSKGWLIECPACGCCHLFTDGRWSFNGDVNKPTFSPSMLVKSSVYPSGGNFPTDDEHARMMAGEVMQMKPSVCHSFVKDGKIEYLSDCTHELAGKTIDLPEM